MFIIIAAVLGIGGVVTASAYGLVSSGASSSSAQIVSTSLTGVTGSNPGTFTMALTLKNVGTTPVILSASNPLNVTIAGVKGSTGAVCTDTGSIAWTCAHATSSASLIDWAATSGTVAPGQQVSLLGTLTSTSANPISSGTTYSVNVLFGTSSTSVKLTAQ